MFDEKILIDNGVNLAKSLELFGDMETYNDTLKDFLNDVENKLANIDKYKESADMKNYAILVHSLKSDAKYFGFEKLAELALNHELQSKENNMYYVTDHYSELITEARRIVDIVKVYMGLKTNISTEEETKVEKIDRQLLVVDDSNVISNFITRIFNSSLDLFIAKDGSEAIDTLSNLYEKIDGMLLDLNMPNVNGYEVLKFMKTNNLFKYVKVAIITGNDSQSVLEEVKDYPIVAILEKPFNEKNVRKVVEMLIN